jgi:hypothetical protein
MQHHQAFTSTVSWTRPSHRLGQLKRYARSLKYSFQIGRGVGEDVTANTVSTSKRRVAQCIVSCRRGSYFHRIFKLCNYLSQTLATTQPRPYRRRISITWRTAWQTTVNRRVLSSDTPPESVRFRSFHPYTPPTDP